MYLNLHSHSEGGEGVYCAEPGVPVTRSGEACQRAPAACEVCDSTVQVPQEGEPGYTDPAGDFSFWAPAMVGWGQTVKSVKRFCFLRTSLLCTRNELTDAH